MVLEYAAQSLIHGLYRVTILSAVLITVEPTRNSKGCAMSQWLD